MMHDGDMSNNTPNLTSVRDYGFTHMTEDDINNDTNILVNSLRAKQEAAQLSLVKAKKMIWPLLEQLKRDPAKDIIKWPGEARIDAVNELMKALEDLLK